MVATSDIEAILGRDLTAAELERVERLVEMAEAQLEAALPGFSVATGTATAEEIVHDDPDVAWTRYYPVTDVTSVSVGDAVLGSTAYTWTEKGKLILGHRSILNEFEVNLPSWPTGLPLSVTYGYGFNPVPADIAAGIAASVAGLLRQQATNPDGVRSTSLGAFAESYFDLGGPGGLAPVAAKAFRKWSRTPTSAPLVRYR